MWRTVVFLGIMAVIAPYVTRLGRPYCGPEVFVPMKCGSFWWMLALAVGPLVIVVASGWQLRKPKNRNMTDDI